MLQLAGHLRDIRGDIAPAGLRERSLQADAIADDFDLAEALLRPDSLAAALKVLNRRELAVLRLLSAGPRSIDDIEGEIDGGAAAAATCLARMLVVGDANELHALDEVTAELDRCGIDGLAQLRAEEFPVALVSHAVDTSLIDRLAAEAASQTCSAVAELVLTLGLEPARELAKGGLALPDAKRIAAAAHIELEEVDGIHRLARAAGLVFCQAGEWLPSSEATGWLDGSVAHRWHDLARAAWLSQPPELRRAAHTLVSEAPRDEPSMARLAELMAWQFPAFDGTAALLSQFAELASRVGILIGEELTAPGRLLAAGGDTEAFTALVGQLLPGEVNQVYVQPDSSIVVPGPASPSLDRMLRRFAEVERSDLASSFRLSSVSLNRALSTGLSVPEIRAFLSEVSLSGIPQPVEFILANAEAQFGTIRVRSFDRPPFACAIRSLDPHMLEVLAVDHTLHSLGLTREGEFLVTRVGVTHTLMVLEAAKYPAALEDESGAIVPVQPNVARARDAASAVDPVQAMWTRVLASRESTDDATAWLSRQVQAAVKAKTPVSVEVRLPGGGTAMYHLEPTGLAGNRMRARDRRADIERTLPLSSIVSLKPAGPAN